MRCCARPSWWRRACNEHCNTGPSLPVRHCDTMAEVRSHIDALDTRITVSFLVERTGIT